MASKQNQVVFQCSGCQEELDLNSKTLPCFHSFCRSCLDKHFKDETNGKVQCPECHEPLNFDQLSLSQFLTKSFRWRQLESKVWKCDLCSEDGIEAAATIWCHGCQKLQCTNCNRILKKFHTNHNQIHLNGMEKGELIKVMMTDICFLHKKAKDMYCERCNVCLCDTCYQKHSSDSPECSSRPLSVTEEALKQKSKGATMAKEIDDFVMSLKRLNERTMNYKEELNLDCDSKCKQLWQNLEKMWENAKQRTEDVCKEIRQITTDQVKRWQHLLDENEKILKQLEIWSINLRILLDEPQEDVDIVCGLRSLRSKLSSRLDKSVGPEEKCQLGVTSPNWWLQALEQLKSENIGSVSLTVEELTAKNLVFDKQWVLPGTNSGICVSDEDSHVFVCDENNKSIIEFTEGGEFFCECKLFEGTNKFKPIDMCLVSPSIFVVACYQKKTIIFLERREFPPYLQIMKFIDTNKQFYSLCEINKSIFVCDLRFQVDSFTKEGEKLKTIKTGELTDGFLPRIRSDPVTGNFWGTEIFSSEIFCFNQNGQRLRSVKTEMKITDFCVNEFGHLYFCNWEGIFSFSPKKVLCKFEKQSEDAPRIFILKNKIFISLRIDGKHLIKIFKSLD